VEAARWGSREVEITAVEITGADASERRVYHPNDSMRISISYQVHAAQSDLVFGVGIHRADGLNVFGTNTSIDRVELPGLTSGGEIDCVIDRLGLLDGAYVLDVAAHRADGYPFDYHKSAVHFSIRSDNRVVGVISPQRSWILNRQEVGRCA
jgi:hypothetical protein